MSSNAPSSGNSSGNTDAENYARMLLGWLLAIVVLAAISRTRAGYVLIYYALVLMIVLLILGSTPRVVDLLGFVRAPGPSSPPGPSSEGAA